MDDGRVPPCGRNHASCSRFPNSPMCVGRLDVEMSCQGCVAGRDGGLDGQRVDNDRCSTGAVRDTAHGSRHSGGRLVVDFMKRRDGREPMVSPSGRSFLPRSLAVVEAGTKPECRRVPKVARLGIVRGRHRHERRIEEARAGRAEKRRYRSPCRLCRWSGGNGPAAG